MLSWRPIKKPLKVKTVWKECIRHPITGITSSLCESERAYNRWPIIHHSDSIFATWVPKQCHGNSGCLLPGDCEYAMSWGCGLVPTEERYRSKKVRCAHSHTGEGWRSDVQTGGMWRSENSNAAAENRLRARADSHTRALRHTNISFRAHKKLGIGHGKDTALKWTHTACRNKPTRWTITLREELKKTKQNDRHFFTAVTSVTWLASNPTINTCKAHLHAKQKHAV